MTIIDFHTHAFPDSIASRALSVLQENSGVAPETDGTVAGLLALMDATGVDKAVVHSIATRKEQVDSILAWALSIKTDRIIPFASLHPLTPDPDEAAARIVKAGICGIKLHPQYQNFEVDDPKVFPLYQAISDAGVVLLMHAGYDIAFTDDDKASPIRFARVVREFPKLKMVLAHMGGWNCLDQFIEHLAGKNITIDTAFTLGYCSPGQLQTILSRHGTDRIVFGSDSPWGRIAEQIGYVKSFPIPEEAKEKILFRNAQQLFQAI